MEEEVKEEEPVSTARACDSEPRWTRAYDSDPRPGNIQFQFLSLRLSFLRGTDL